MSTADEASLIPQSCGHGSVEEFVPALAGCIWCAGTGRVDYESDEYPPGTNACCCTCSRCRRSAAEKVSAKEKKLR